MQNKPKVSVLMPAYNVEKYIAEAIESVLNQTFSDFEFIIINDASTDSTPDIIRQYAEKDKRIKFITHAKNEGFVAKLNECLDLATGEYVAKMDSDDISLPERLEKQVRFLDNNPDVGMVGVGVKKIGTRTSTDIRPERVGIADFMCGCMTTVFMARRDIIEKNNLRFDSNYFAAEDMEFYSRFARYSKIANLQDVLYLYRFHGENVSVKKQELQQRTVDVIRSDIGNFLTGNKFVFERLVHTFRWFRLAGVPIIKIKNYNMSRSKYYLFGFLPLVLIDGNGVFLFGFIKIGVVK